MDELVIRAAGSRDRAAVAEVLTRSWGGTLIVGHGVMYDAATLPALMAWRGDRLDGLLTYSIGRDGLEVVSIDALAPRSGVGGALLDAAVGVATAAGLKRLWLITTNDNLDALRFYQRRGLRIVGVAPGAVDEARRIKPSIPLVGEYDIEIHDELTLELRIARR
jgi:GNAT superfamily N-acetyltransferase